MAKSPTAADVVTGRHVLDLNVPPTTKNLALFKTQLAGMSGKGEDYPAKVVGSPTGSKVQVVFQGAFKTVNLATTVKAVQDADRVQIRKKGGQWWLVSVDTWHEPPSVGAAPPTTTPAAASTMSGSVSASVSTRPESPQSSPGTVTSSHTTYLNNLQSWTWRLDNWLQFAVRERLIDLANHANNTTSVTNSNAGKLNQTRDVATGTRDSVGGLREGALQDRIVK